MQIDSEIGSDYLGSVCVRERGGEEGTQRETDTESRDETEIHRET